MIKFWKFLSIWIVAAVCLGLLLMPGAQQAMAAGDEWSYEVVPNMTNVGFDENFTVNVSCVRYDGNATSFYLALTFNASLLQVTGVDTPSTLPNGDTPEMSLGYPAWNNVAGYVVNQYSMQPPYESPYVNETFTMSTIHFKSLNATGTSDLNLANVDITNVTMIRFLFTDTTNWTKVVNGTVIIGPTFNLTVTSIGCCPITVGSLGTVAANDTGTFIVLCTNVTLNASAGVCCDFVNWTVDGGAPNTTNPIVVTGAVNTSHTANATCSAPEYNLTMNVTGSGTTTPTSGTTTTCSCGEEVAISATADPGWWFGNWTTDDMDEIADPTANSTNVTMDKNKTVTANFVQRYNLTMNVTGNGNTTPPIGNHTYDNGTVVNITAMPDACWDFVNWTGDVTDPNSTSTNVTVDTNKTVIAHFAQVNYTLNITSTAGGVTEPVEGDHSYINCTVVNLTATPDDGYAFVAWSGNVSTIGNVNSSATNITMTGNCSIMAHFGPQKFSARPISLTFTTIEGENPPSQTIEICNTGNGTLNWSLTGNAAWLSGSPTSGSLPEDGCELVTVSVDVAGMKAGDYRATITFTGSPLLEVPVSLHIESAMWEIPGGPAGLSASALSISPQQVQPGQDVTISINVANTGGETGSYNAILYINSAVEDSQSVSVAAGTTKNVIFTVSKSPAGVYDVSLAGQSGQFEVVGGGGWFGGGLGTGGIIAIVVIVIVLIAAVVFILRGTRREV